MLSPHSGSVTEKGVRTNIEVGIKYIAAWLSGKGRSSHSQSNGGCCYSRNISVPDMAMAGSSGNCQNGRWVL